MTRRELHKTMLKRLVPAWLLLSVITGMIVYFVELEKVDKFVVDLAVRESEKIITDYLLHLSEPHKVDLGQYTGQKRKEDGGSQFVVVELYNRDRELVAEEIKKGSEAVELAMDSSRHELLMGQSVKYKKVYSGGRLHLMVMVPLRSEGGDTAGFFEGVYQVDQQTLSDIRGRITGSVLLVIAVISATTLILYPVILNLNRKLFMRSMELYQADLAMIEILGNAIAKRDSDTHLHNYRVTIYSIRLAEAMHLDKEGMQKLIKGAFLHDIGKIGISDSILLKAGGLTPEETEIMRSHVRHGAEILGDYPWLRDAIPVVYFHHEKNDGTGFVQGLAGQLIPFHARIFSICDVFDALTSKRPYKEAFSFERSMELISTMRGTHFDPLITDQFCAIAGELYAEINRADEAFLRDRLNQLIDRYFKVKLS